MSLENRQRIRSEARRQAVAQLSRKGTDAARRQLLRVLEAETNRLPAVERSPVACRAGCAFCCHLRVAVTAAEVFGLLDYLHKQLDAAEFEALIQRVESAAQRLHALAPETLLSVNLPCPVLVDGVCSGYAGRPFNCRSYHSLDRDACEASFNEPANLSMGHPQYAALARVHEGIQGGFRDALQQVGHDASQVELTTALAEALQDDACRERYLRGERVFNRALRLP